MADYLKDWTDHPDNPLIEPPWPEFLLGDPSVVLPADSPDGAWHMFANTLTGIQHFTAVDGLHWGRHPKVGPGMRAFVYKEDGRFYLYYERFTIPQFRSHIELRESDDLWSWTEPEVVLVPDLPFEGRLSQNVGNPCLVKMGDGYILYYSAGIVFLRDLGFCEPRYVAVATSEGPRGPFNKEGRPMIAPESSDPYLNRGAGAIKVIEDPAGGRWLGFNNGIYRDADGRSRSAILLLTSKNGLEWKRLYSEPIVAPGGDVWKKALVYQLDVHRVGDEMWMYYNARSGWRFGTERIGLATCPLPAPRRKKS
ncbi:MAG: family 43 glycosylhydrolase [Actinobacteria bacterium]|nr:family 43 glycosylhydrolase [Actinomycetota bacterium]MBU1944836.1 family 43 glycosylhydrolase [Actinomycetota bacterium]MBU2687097.1 family 43 glycosylhydrolase [Actinomycetota bacterium]